MNQFREAKQTAKIQEEAQKQATQQVINNPFASYNENVLGQIGDLERADLAEQPSYFKPVPLNTTNAVVTQQEIDTPELDNARDMF